MADYRCVKCGGDQRLEVTEAQIPDYQYSNSVVPLTLTAAWVKEPEAWFLLQWGRAPGRQSAS